MLRAEDLRLMQAALVLDQDRNLNAAARARAEDAGRRQAARRRWWVRPWFVRRPEQGWFEQLMEELRVEDVASFRNFVRVEPALFRELSDRLEQRLTREDTFFRYTQFHNCTTAQCNFQCILILCVLI